MKLQFVCSTSPTNNTGPDPLTTGRGTLIIQGHGVFADAAR
jgi:hypothetical protein